MSGRMHAETQAAPKSSFSSVRTGLLADSRGKQLVSQPPLIQAKLTINQPNDRYEQEADRVAEQVMRMPESVIQRRPGCPSAGNLPCVDEDSEELLQTKPLAARITPLIQSPGDGEAIPQAWETSDHSSQVTPDLTGRINSLRARGQPLLESTRTFFERRFGFDLSRVRVHTDARAAESARAMNAQACTIVSFGDVRVHTGSMAARAAASLNARAFTFGNDIVFADGQYNPGSLEGRKLLGHELVHVVQQGGGDAFVMDEKKMIQRQIRIGTPTEDYEIAASDLLVSEAAYLESLAQTSEDANLIAMHPVEVNSLISGMLASSEVFSFESEYDFVVDLLERIRRILAFVQEVESEGFDEYCDATRDLFLRNPQITINYVRRNALEASQCGLHGIYLLLYANIFSRHLNRWLDMSREQRTLYVMDRFITEYRFPLSSAAALAGNLWLESGLLPNRVEGSREEAPSTAPSFRGGLQDFTAEQVRSQSSRRRTGPQRPGVGLAQWTTVSRREGLFEFRQMGVDILYDMNAQIDYVVHELRNSVGFQNLYRRLMSQPNSPEGLRNASDDIAYIYLRPSRIVPVVEDEEESSSGSSRRVLLPRNHPEVQSVFRARLNASQAALQIYNNRP